jgi:glycerol kinase
MPKFILAIDQGTTSTRCVLFDHESRLVASAQAEHRQIYPRPGWVEHDAMEIWLTTQGLVRQVLDRADSKPGDIEGIGITNQRETIVVWEKSTGTPIHHAIVWQDTRTDEQCRRLAEKGGQDRLRDKTGLPIATYFSGPKLQWLLDQIPGARERARRGELLFGTMDTWLIWNLTGGVHVTDPSNASRTLLMNLATLDWDDELLDLMQIPRTLLPAIRPSAEVYGLATGLLNAVPVAGDLGDQQAALFGQTGFSRGEVKNTYGTGCFMLLNTGGNCLPSRHGLLTTVAYQLSDHPPVYALEGSVAVTGSLVQWLRDNLGLIKSAPEIESLANTVADNGGVYIVPAFSGLFAPYWRSDARGVIVGLTRYANKGHLARATLEATAYQTREILDAMRADTGLPISELRVDGGMVVNDTLMQFQADLLNAPVIRPKITETTALGAAYMAGLAVGFWRNTGELRALWQEDRRWQPAMDTARRATLYAGWRKAVTRTFNWIDPAPADA